MAHPGLTDRPTSAHPDRAICSWSHNGTAVPDRDRGVALEAEERAGADRAQANHRTGTLDASGPILSPFLDLNKPDGSGGAAGGTSGSLLAAY